MNFPVLFFFLYVRQSLFSLNQIMIFMQILIYKYYIFLTSLPTLTLKFPSTKLSSALFLNQRSILPLSTTYFRWSSHSWLRCKGHFAKNMHVMFIMCAFCAQEEETTSLSLIGVPFLISWLHVLPLKRNLPIQISTFFLHSHLIPSFSPLSPT